MAGCGGGGGEHLISECLQELVVIGKGESQKCKKEKKRYPSARLLCYLLASAGPCTVFSWASFFSQFPRLPAQACALGLCGGDAGSGSAPCCVGQSSDTCPGWELGVGGGETCQVHPSRGSSRDYPCSAGLTSALAGDLRVQSKQQEQSKIKPFRGAMEK